MSADFLIRPDRIYQLRTHYRYENESEFIHTTWFRPNANFEPGTVTFGDVTGTAKEAWLQFATACLSDTIVVDYNRLVEFGLTTKTGFRYSEDSVEAQGGLNDPPASPQDCVVVTHETGLVGARNRGRSYFSGVPKTWQLGGYWGGAQWNLKLGAFLAVCNYPIMVGEVRVMEQGVVSTNYVEQQGKKVFSSREFGTTVLHTRKGIIRCQRRRQPGIGM